MINNPKTNKEYINWIIELKKVQQLVGQIQRVIS